MEWRRVVIAGGGPGGLATAVQLGRRRVAALIVEQGAGVGTAWRDRYDRLRLNSSRWSSQLPGARYPRRAGIFPPRDEVVRYLEEYAQHHHLEVRTRTRLARLDRSREGWCLLTSTGVLIAEPVVIACGYEHTPLIPSWPGRDRFGKPLLHAAEYRNAEAFRGQDVLVVGPGSSGMEIARDLVVGGARRVRLAIRRPPNLLLRTALGPLLGRALRHLPPRLADAIMRVHRRRELGDLSAVGLPVPDEGVFTRLAREGVTPSIVDRDTVALISARRIEIVAAVEALDPGGVWLADGFRIETDAVIAATGYRRGLEPIVGHLGVLGEHGAPVAVGADATAPGLRFVGYRPVPAQLGYLGGEAKRAARAIARDLAAVPRAAVRVAAGATIEDGQTSRTSPAGP